METDPRSAATVKQVRAWEAQQRQTLQEYMDSARRLLLNAGVDTAAITVKIQNRKTGFARDIIREAQNGYDALITRRRGMTGMRGIVLGSVATKLIEKLSFLPLILAGKKPPGNKILLAFDGSEGSRSAVEFVGKTTAGFEFEVKLIHVIRGKENSQAEIRRLYSPAQYYESIQKKMTAKLAAAEKRLVDLGLKPNKISTELIGGAASRAAAIVAAAKQQNYGTIILGRRGHSRVLDFIIGRVTNKVIHLARDRTVWVVR
jgi:nucleotide-binding universal stress UspA family protein